MTNTPTPEKYIVLIGSVLGNNKDGFHISYDWDLDVFDDIKAAIKHGFTLGRSDDFNIGVVKNKKLIAIYWMEEDKKEPPEVLKEIEEEICLSDNL